MPRSIHRWSAVACLLALGGVGPAQAQLGLPGLPSLPGGVGRVPLLRPSEPLLASVPLQELRQRTVRDLLRQHRDLLEADPAGEPVRRAELLLVSPAQATLDAALALGFRLLRDAVFEGLDTRSVVLQPPRGLSTAAALARLRTLDPGLEVDFNHVYTRSGSTGEAPTERAASSPTTAGATALPGPRIGLVDGGVDRAHPALRRASLTHWGCDGRTVASAHGTAIASLLVGRDARFVGVVPEAMLYAADVYCEHPDGGSVEAVASALAWLARERVPVINVSLVGPPNRLLERAVRALSARGHLVVAAVGNDGPAAPPLYPASYPEVIGVTGVTPARKALPEAALGPQVAFAAPGAELSVASAGASGYSVARGTSFAAPVVAGLLSRGLALPESAAAQRAVQQLADSATDLGAPGRDGQFGWGLVGEQARIAPERVQAAARKQM
ncbi:MAG: S8 family serine peptidase [Pseudomonadota bacterium]